MGNKRSSAAATVAIVVLVGAKLPQFCTFYTAREKKRIIFGGNATILSAVVMWDQLVSTAAARYTCPPRVLRSATGSMCSRMSLWSGDDFATSFTPRCTMIAAILTTLKNNSWNLSRVSHQPPINLAITSIEIVTGDVISIVLFYFLWFWWHQSEMFSLTCAMTMCMRTVKCQRNFKLQDMWLFVLPSACSANKWSPFWWTFILLPLGVIIQFYIWNSITMTINND